MQESHLNCRNRDRIRIRELRVNGRIRVGFVRNSRIRVGFVRSGQFRLFEGMELAHLSDHTSKSGQSGVGSA